MEEVKVEELKYNDSSIKYRKISPLEYEVNNEIDLEKTKDLSKELNLAQDLEKTLIMESTNEGK